VQRFVAQPLPDARSTSAREAHVLPQVPQPNKALEATYQPFGLSFQRGDQDVQWAGLVVSRRALVAGLNVAIKLQQSRSTISSITVDRFLVSTTLQPNGKRPCVDDTMAKRSCRA